MCTAVNYLVRAAALFSCLRRDIAGVATSVMPACTSSTGHPSELSRTWTTPTSSTLIRTSRTATPTPSAAVAQCAPSSMYPPINPIQEYPTKQQPLRHQGGLLRRRHEHPTFRHFHI